MRIYNRQDFMKLPEGTIFAKGKPMYFGDLCVKGQTLTHDGHDCDFVQRSLVWFENSGTSDMDLVWEAMEKDGASVPINSDYGRDGCFDDKDLFLVYEHDDLVELKQVLTTAIGDEIRVVTHLDKFK